MRKLLIILFLCSTIQLYAQNIGPTRHLFTIRGTTVNLSDTNLDDFRQTEFLMGWHWNSFWAYDLSVRANQRDIYSTDTDRINNNTYLFVKPAGDWYPTIYTHCWGPEVLNCRGIEYEPTLLKTDENATRGEMIFGFKNIRGRIINDTNDENYSRLILDGDSLQNEIVLANNWPDDQLTFNNYTDTGRDTTNIRIQKEYLNRTLYLCINLRRFGEDNTEDTATVLRIEAPYK